MFRTAHHDWYDAAQSSVDRAAFSVRAVSATKHGCKQASGTLAASGRCHAGRRSLSLVVFQSSSTQSSAGWCRAHSSAAGSSKATTIRCRLGSSGCALRDPRNTGVWPSMPGVLVICAHGAAGVTAVHRPRRRLGRLSTADRETTGATKPCSIGIGCRSTTD